MATARWHPVFRLSILPGYKLARFFQEDLSVASFWSVKLKCWLKIMAMARLLAKIRPNKLKRLMMSIRSPDITGLFI